MPRTRKATSGPTAAAQQSRLSFNNKVTKPNAVGKNAGTKRVKDAKLNEPAEKIITAEIVKQNTPEPETERSPGTELKKTVTPKKSSAKKVEVESPVNIIPSPSQQRKRIRRTTDDDDAGEVDLFEKAKVEAQKVSDARIKKYWKDEEESRLSARVHQSPLPLPEKMLRHFDLSNEYGPCIGLDRLTRWKRAVSLGLEPPIEILAVLLQEEKKRTKGVNVGSVWDEIMAGGKD